MPRASLEVPTRKEPEKVIVGPQAGMQTEFLACPYTEVLIGGEAGGGKSWALTMDALRYYQEKNYSAIIFRRTFPDLEDLIHKTMEWYKPLGFDFNEQKHTFFHPEFGSRIKFSHLQHIKDIYNHQGQEYDYIGFDELPHFPKLAYTYLFSRLRGVNPNVKRYVRSTANPDGEHILWVKARFVDCLEPLVPKWFLTDNDRDKEVPRGTPESVSRCFIPSIRSENLLLAKADPGYEARLNQLPEHKKRALKFGMWETLDQPFQVVRTKDWVKALSGDNRRVSGLNALGADYAESGDRCALCIGEGNRVTRFKEWPGMETGEFAQVILKESEKLSSLGGNRNTCIGIDSIGPGTGVYHDLRKANKGFRLDPMRYKDPAYDKLVKLSRDKIQFNNLKSQMWWKFKEDMAHGRIDLSILQGEAGFYENLHLLQEEVLAHTYKEENGVIKIIDKNILRDAEHLGRSPDRADALVIWNWVRERHREQKDPEPVDTHFNPEFNRNRQAIRQRLLSGHDRDAIISEEEAGEWQAL